MWVHLYKCGSNASVIGLIFNIKDKSLRLLKKYFFYFYFVSESERQDVHVYISYNKAIVLLFSFYSKIS